MSGFRMPVSREKVSSTVTVVSSTSPADAASSALARLRAHASTMTSASALGLVADMFGPLAPDMRLAATAHPRELAAYLASAYPSEATGMAAYHEIVFYCASEGRTASPRLVDAVLADFGPQGVTELLAKYPDLRRNRAVVLHALSDPGLAPVVDALVDEHPSVLRDMDSTPEVATRYAELFVRVMDAAPSEVIARWLRTSPQAVASVAPGRCREVILDDPAAFLESDVAISLVPDLLDVAQGTDAYGVSRVLQARLLEEDLQRAEARYKGASTSRVRLPVQRLSASAPTAGRSAGSAG